VEKYVYPVSHIHAVNLRQIFSFKMSTYISGSKRAYKNCDKNILPNISQVVLRLRYAFFEHVVGEEFLVAYQKLDVFGVTLLQMK
jgi:hypothetical protein